MSEMSQVLIAILVALNGVMLWRVCEFKRLVVGLEDDLELMNVDIVTLYVHTLVYKEVIKEAVVDDLPPERAEKLVKDNVARVSKAYGDIDIDINNFWDIHTND